MLATARFFAVFALAAFSMAAPEQLEKRQDYSGLLRIASLAGISLPTDPAVILQLGPLASNLAAALPTSSVLVVLETAAPSSFLSQVVHDPSFARSFESAFAAGSSPSWFTALPTDIKSYLHTYPGFGGLATAAGAVQSAEARATSALETPGGTTAAPSSIGGQMTLTPRSTATSGASASSARTASTTGGSTISGTAATTSASQNSPTTNGVGRPTRAIAANFAGVVCFLAAAVVL